ncbi:MAG: hypothetical protein ACE5L6_02465 [Candidatus Bathyarchaeia archaeon]
MTLDFILKQEIVFERRIRDAISEACIVSHSVNDDDVTEAEKLLKKWKGLALADALIITTGSKLRKEREVFMVTDDLIERKAAEENHLNTLWSSTLAVVFHYLSCTSLPRYIKDVKERRVLWISKGILKALKVFETKEAIEILLSLHERSKSRRNLVSCYSADIVDAMTEAGILTLKEGKYSLNERSDVTKIIPNIKALVGS